MFEPKISAGTFNNTLENFKGGSNLKITGTGF